MNNMVGPEYAKVMEFDGKDFVRIDQDEDLNVLSQYFENEEAENVFEKHFEELLKQGNVTENLQPFHNNSVKKNL